MRCTFGEVKNNGTILNSGSSDWQCSRDDRGKYNVTFSPPFETQPVVVATVLGDPDNVIHLRTISQTGFSAHTLDVQATEAGTFQDTHFSFIAISNN